MSTNMFVWFKNLLHPYVQDGQRPRFEDSDSTNRSFRIPVGIRKEDAFIFVPGTIVNFGLQMLIVKFPLISNDLKQLTLSLKGISEIIPEEIIISANEVSPVDTWDLSDEINTKSKEIASSSLNELLEEMCYYPKHIKRAARFNVVAAKIRRYIKHFLEGLDLTTTVNLGLLDWDHDPSILGLSENQPRIVYGIEDKNTHFLDTFLGPQWDIINLPTMDSFRIILTLELKITSGSDLCLTAHGILCNKKPILEEDYRSQYLKFAAEKSVIVLPEGRSTFEITNNSKENDTTNKASLFWDSFNIQNEDNRLSTPIAEENYEEEDSMIQMPAPTTNIHKNSSSNGEDTINETVRDIHNASNDKKNISFNSEESGSSRAQSRFSNLSHSTATSTKPRLQGFFQKIPSITSNVNTMQCPFPTELIHGTVPEVITDNNEVD